MTKPSRQFPSGWLVVTLLGIFVGTALLLGLRDRGAQIAGVLSLAVAVLVPLAANVRGGDQHFPLIRASGIAIVVGSIGVGLYFLYEHQRSIDITEHVRVSVPRAADESAENSEDGPGPGVARLAVEDPDHPSEARVVIEAEQDDRPNLEIGFSLTEAFPERSYCFGASVRLESATGELVKLSSDESATIPLTAPVRKRELTAVLEAEPKCVLDVSVTKAVLHK